MLYHKWAGAFQAGQDGCGGPHAASRDRPGRTLWFLQFLLPAGGDKSITEKTTAAAAEADAGVVFYKYGATGINVVQHYQEQARAASGFSRSHWRARAKSVYNKLSSLQCARGINSAEYGRRRRTGAAEPRPTFIWPAGRAKGGSCKMQTSLGAGARRVSAAALRTRLLAARSSAGPRSGHACDDISRISFPVPQI